LDEVSNENLDRDLSGERKLTGLMGSARFAAVHMTHRPLSASLSVSN